MLFRSQNRTRQRASSNVVSKVLPRPNDNTDTNMQPSKSNADQLKKGKDILIGEVKSHGKVGPILSCHNADKKKQSCECCKRLPKKTPRPNKPYLQRTLYASKPILETMTRFPFPIHQRTDAEMAQWYLRDPDPKEHDQNSGRNRDIVLIQLNHATPIIIRHSTGGNTSTLPLRSEAESKRGELLGKAVAGGGWGWPAERPRQAITARQYSCCCTAAYPGHEGPRGTLR